MSGAEDLGRKLWGEVRVQRLDELLTTLRLLQDPSQSYNLGIRALSNLLASTQQHSIDPTSLSLNPTPPILEVTSPTPGSGKTSLLYLITALSILPSRYGGQDAAICILDTEVAFSIPKLVETLQTNLPPDAATTEVKSIISDALRHVHVFRPPTLQSLIATTKTLPTYFLSPQNPSTNKRLAAVILDSASSYIYPDRFTQAQTSSDSTHTSKTSSGYILLASLLKSLTKTLSCPLIYTTWNLDSKTGLRNQLPGIWAQITTAKIVVKRQRVGGFGREVTVQEVVREMEKRDKIVGEGEIEVLLIGSKGERMGEGFSIRSTEKGVQVIED